ncbi:MAG TPA: inositol 2-dehydrogenase [Symbiobacteriaceae bacterium]|nr:inositol 2-dehydrogenase [Symbiobacteriaceae bacterium]
MSKSTLNCAVLGLGKMGFRHADLLANRVPGARLVAVQDPIEPHLRNVSAQLGAKGYLDYQEVLNDPAVDAVFIITPSTTHAEICMAAAKAGKAIFCEKPLALSVAECEAIDHVVKQTGTPLQLGFMRRFDPGYAAAKRAIAEGAIGEVVAYNGISRDPQAPPREYVAQSGGIYLDCLIHEFDIARFLMGDEVKRLHATGKVLMNDWMHALNDVDHAHVVLEFEKGGLGHIEGSRNAIYGYDIRAEVMGTKGTIAIGQERHTPITIQTKSGVVRDYMPGYLERFSEAYHIELIEFVQTVLAGKTPSVGAWDGRQALLLALAAKRSQELGAPVEVESVAR